MLVERNATLLDDRVHRSLAVLRNARLLGAEEAMKLLSRVRLGVHLRRVDEVEIDLINRLLLQIQPAHLQLHVGADLSADRLREVRATVVRKALQ